MSDDIYKGTPLERIGPAATELSFDAERCSECLYDTTMLPAHDPDGCSRGGPRDVVRPEPTNNSPASGGRINRAATGDSGTGTEAPDAGPAAAKGDLSDDGLLAWAERFLPSHRHLQPTLAEFGKRVRDAARAADDDGWNALTEHVSRATVERISAALSDPGSVFVREQVGGRWGSYSLSELPADRAIWHAVRFFREGRVPVAVKEQTND